MLIGLSILVAFAAAFAYRRGRRWLLLSSASSAISTKDSSSLSAASSNSFMAIAWAYLSLPFLKGINSSANSPEARARGLSASEGGICAGNGGSSSTSSSQGHISSIPFPSLSTPIAKMKTSLVFNISPDSTPKVQPINGTTLGSLNLNGTVPVITLSNDSPSDSEGDNDNAPPSFPSLNSAQRARPSSTTTRPLALSPITQQFRYPSAATRAPSISILHSDDKSPSRSTPPSSPSSASYNPMPPPPLPQVWGRNPRSAPTTIPFPSRLPSSSYSQSTSTARGGGAQSRNVVYSSSSGGISSIPSGDNNRLHLPPSTNVLPKLKVKEKMKYNRKVILEPGYSPLDWARLCRTSSSEVLRGPGLPPDRLIKVSPSMLAKRGKKPKPQQRQLPSSFSTDNSTSSNAATLAPKANRVVGSKSEKKQRGDRGEEEQEEAVPHQMWTALSGKVYNITAYTPFHPGGEKELLRCAGKDGTELFMKTHSWVNVEGMLGQCLVGILVAEGEGDEDIGKRNDGDNVITDFVGVATAISNLNTWLDAVD